MICSNFNCGAYAWGKRIRCANCRRADINKCCDCDTDTTRRALLCNDCRLGHRDATAEKISGPKKVRGPKIMVYPRPYHNCLMCEEILPSRILKVCQGGDCLRIYKNLRMIVRRGRYNITN